MTKTVMVIGCYGAVGSLISSELAASGGLRLIVAGRRLEPAAHVARQLGAEARRVDVAVPETWAAGATPAPPPRTSGFTEAMNRARAPACRA